MGAAHGNAFDLSCVASQMSAAKLGNDKNQGAAEIPPFQYMPGLNTRLLALLIILAMGTGKSAQAKETVTSLPGGGVQIVVDSDSPNPLNTTIGGGRSWYAGYPVIIDIKPGGEVRVTNTNAISVGDDATITVAGSLIGNSNINKSGLFKTGPNVIEVNSNSSILIEEGGLVQQSGTTTNGETINLHGFSNRIENYGTIMGGANSSAIWFDDEVSTGGDHNKRNIIINHGLIARGTSGAPGTGNVMGSSGNTGVIFHNKSGGMVRGDLRFANGDDDLYFEAGSYVTGNIDGGSGSNRLFLEGDRGLGMGILADGTRNFQTLTKIDSGTWVITGSLEGFMITTVDDGILRLTGNNTNYSGSLAISPAGILEARAQSLPYQNPIAGNTQSIENNGTLRFIQGMYGFGTADTGTYNGQITGAGRVEVAGPGTVILMPAAANGNTYSGGTHIQNGILAISADNALGATGSALTMGHASGGGSTAGTLRLESQFDLDPNRNISFLGLGGIFDTQGFVATLRQDIVSPGIMGKRGTGTLVLIGDNTNSEIQVHQGTVQVGDGGTIGSIANNQSVLLEGADSTLAFNRSDAVEFGGGIRKAGKVVQRGSGTLIMKNTANYPPNTYTGGTEIENGTILVSDADAYSRTAGASNRAGHFRYSSAGAGNLRTIDVDAGVTQIQNHVHIDGGGIANNVFQINGDLEIADVASNDTTGGAFYVNNGAGLTINVGADGRSGVDLTLANNSYNGVANDMYIDRNAVLNLNAAGSAGNATNGGVFINSGIAGRGTINMNGPGVIQIAADSSMGTTKVSGTELRVVGGKTYSGDTFNLGGSSILAGDGTVSATANSVISGILSPDAQIYTSGSDGTGFDAATLRITGGATTFDGFTFNYDVMAANTDRNPANTQNDLIRLGSQAVIMNGGNTINIRTRPGLEPGSYEPLETGNYLIMDSAGASFRSANNTILSDTALSALFRTTLNGNAIVAESPRRTFSYHFASQEGASADSQIWLRYGRNSLTMDWAGIPDRTQSNTVPANGLWDYDRDCMISLQTVSQGTALHEHRFSDGDKVHISNSRNDASDIAIKLTKNTDPNAGTNLLISGLVIGKSSAGVVTDGNALIEGLGGITAKLADSAINGMYLEDGTLVPTGRLEKFGQGTVTLANIGGNSFEQGVDIHGGGVTIAAEDAIDAYAGGPAGTITFINDSASLGDADSTTKKYTYAVQQGTVDPAEYKSVINYFVVEDRVAGAAITTSANDGSEKINNLLLADTGNANEAVSVGEEAGLTLNADGGDIVFQPRSGGRDITLGNGSTLIFAGSQGVFINNGIAGIGKQVVIREEGGSFLDGFTQIGADSPLYADTTVRGSSAQDAGGIFRVVGGVAYGSLKHSAASTDSTFTVEGDGLASAGTLAGGGTVRADRIHIQGILSPDSYVLETSPGLPVATVASGDKYGTLTLDAGASGTVLLDGFTLNFDAAGPTEAAGSATGNAQDLLVIHGGRGNSKTVKIFDGIVNFHTGSGNSFALGDYKVIVSDYGFDTGSKDLDGINITGGALQATINGRDASEVINTPRGRLGYEYRTSAGSLVVDNEIWVTNELNSLTMDWTGGGTVDVPVTAAWNYGPNIMESRQGQNATHEMHFMDGDKVHIRNSGASLLGVATEPITTGGVANDFFTVSGLVVGRGSDGATGNGDVAITGFGGIMADAAGAFGYYIKSQAGELQLIPTGKLEKYGTGFLSFQNTGGNSFIGGIDIHAGTIEMGFQGVLGIFSDNTNDANLVAFVNDISSGIDSTAKIITATASQTIKNKFVVADGVIGAIIGSKITATPQDAALVTIAPDTTGPAVNIGADATLEMRIDADNQIVMRGGFASSGNGSELRKTGDGALHLAADSPINAEITTVERGTFHVREGVTYGGAGNGDFSVQTDAMLSGAGTIKANRVLIHGIIDPDKTEAPTTGDTANSEYANLTIAASGGNDKTTVLSGFIFNYDASGPNTGDGSPEDRNKNDLLSITGMNSIKMESVTDTEGTAGTVNFRTEGARHLTYGKYLIIDGNGTAIDIDNDKVPSAVLAGKINGASFAGESPRAAYAFRYNTAEEAAKKNSQIWLDASRNTLQTIWQGGDNGVWRSAGGNTGGWQSMQLNGSTRDDSFYDGDFAIFDDSHSATDRAVALGNAIIASGVDVNTAAVITITGDFGLEVTKNNHLAPAVPVIVGQYAETSNSNLLDSQGFYTTGMLRKYGDGTLSIANTGENKFHEGAEIYGGTTNLAQDRALGLYDGHKSLSVVTFIGVSPDSGTERRITLGDGVEVRNRFIVSGGANFIESLGGSGITGVEPTPTLKGGAIFFDDNAASALTLDAGGGDLTFAGNTENIGTPAAPNRIANDVRIHGGSVLNLTGDSSIFFNGGIAGATASGKQPEIHVNMGAAGKTQIAAATDDNGNFNGNLNIKSGGFRVINNVLFGGTDSGALVLKRGASLEGETALRFDNVTVDGYVSPDKYDWSTHNPATAAVDDRIGVLTLQGISATSSTITLGLDDGSADGAGFTFGYNAAAANITDYDPRDTIPYGAGNSANDLLKIRDARSVILNGGTIRLLNPLTSGAYLIIDSDRGINVNGRALDGINNTDGILMLQDQSGNAIADATPRGAHAFVFRDGLSTDSQIWLTATVNTLGMNRTGGSGRWTNTGWTSQQQTTAGHTESSFRAGDFAYLSAPTGSSMDLEIDQTVIISGLTVSGDGDITLTGGNGITAVTKTDSDHGQHIEGIYLAQRGPGPLLAPTGQFIKTGNGALVFRNTSLNDFREGIVLAGGLTAFNLGSQLGSGLGKTGNTISFIGDATLRADDSASLNNAVDIQNDVTATFDIPDADTQLKYSGTMTGTDQAKLDKTGAGAMSIYDAPDLQGSTPSGYRGAISVRDGTLAVYGNYGSVSAFSVENGAILSGWGTLGSASGAGGAIKPGGTLAPGGTTAYQSNTVPSNTPLTILGDLTFERGSNYNITLSQYGSDTPNTSGKMTPVSDCVIVNDGSVSIGDSTATLSVQFDFWGGTLTIDDFNERQSGYFTIIDAFGGTVAADALNDQFILKLATHLPRGVTMEQGWDPLRTDSRLYQLWFVNDPDNNFQNLGNTHNTREIGANLDQLLWSGDPALQALIQHISDPGFSNADVVTILNKLTGDIVANTLAMSLKKPWRFPFSRLDSLRPDCRENPDNVFHPQPRADRFQQRLWAQFYGKYTNSRHDGNAHTFDIVRNGFVLGYDHNIGNDLFLGFAFNYSNPRLKQFTGRNKADDYEFGIYNLTRLPGDFELKAYAGYSYQRYTMKRHVYIPGAAGHEALAENFNNKTNGHGLAASLELMRPFCLSPEWRLTPITAFDYEQAWIHAYREHGGVTALAYDRSHATSIVARIGMETGFNARDRLDFKARIQYGRQLNKRDYGRTGVRFADAANAQRTADIHGIRRGRDYLNAGVGLDWKVSKAMTVYAKYDAEIYRRQTTHTADVGISFAW